MEKNNFITSHRKILLTAGDSNIKGFSGLCQCRDQQNISDWKLNKKILLTTIDDYAKNWSEREGCHVTALEEWSEMVKLISGRMENLQRPNFGPCHGILGGPRVRACLTKVQGKYVLVPADKADNNIIFVCKYCYIRTLMEELGINSGTNLNCTYINQVNTADELIQTHTTMLADVFDIKLQQKERGLPWVQYVGFLGFAGRHAGRNLLPVHVRALQLGSPI